jgi:hypothetical protein
MNVPKRYELFFFVIFPHLGGWAWGASSGSWVMTVYGFSGVENSGYATRDLVIVDGITVASCSDPYILSGCCFVFWLAVIYRSHVL